MPDKDILEPTRVVGYNETLIVIGPSGSFVWLFECMLGPSECLIGPLYAADGVL